MRLTSRWSGLGLPLLAAVALFAGGCTQGEGKKVAKGAAVAQAKKSTEGASKHDAWWCDEHGIPEAECSLCSKKVADACKAKGDWCEKHNRAQSQCFKCDPKLKDVFAAKYSAHYSGKEPPPFDDD